MNILSSFMDLPASLAKLDFSVPPTRRTLGQIGVPPGLADGPVGEAAISYIDGKRGRLEYRGIAVQPLGGESWFEEACFLPPKVDLPTQKQLADFDDQL